MNDKTKQANLEHEQLLADLRALLKLKHGRRFIWHLLSTCHINSGSFTGNSQTFFLEGERSIGLHILSLLEQADNHAYPQMILEHLEVQNG